jgi:hypothetical protein
MQDTKQEASTRATHHRMEGAGGGGGGIPLISVGPPVNPETGEPTLNIDEA